MFMIMLGVLVSLLVGPWIVLGFVWYCCRITAFLFDECEGYGWYD